MRSTTAGIKHLELKDAKNANAIKKNEPYFEQVPIHDGPPKKLKLDDDATTGGMRTGATKLDNGKWKFVSKAVRPRSLSLPTTSRASFLLEKRQAPTSRQATIAKMKADMAMISRKLEAVKKCAQE